MAEQQSQTAIVPASPVIDGEYQIEVKEFTAAGTSSKFMVPVPKDVNALSLGFMLTAALLKKTTWKDKDLPTIMLAVAYAERMGLDILAGDVYMAEEGRLSTTAGAKIRHAMKSGKVKGYRVDITEGPVTDFKYSTAKTGEQSLKIPNYKARVEVVVVGFDAPVVYETTLAEWFVGRNPNWRTRPQYMLRRNALSKALEEIAPMGVEADEAPPLVEVPTPSPAGVAVSYEQVRKGE